jgi:hypothetical protein
MRSFDSLRDRGPTLLQRPDPKSLEEIVELLQEAAKRANWDAQHGPQHLRTGRFFISAAMAAHAFKENDDARSVSANAPSGATEERQRS